MRAFAGAIFLLVACCPTPEVEIVSGRMDGTVGPGHTIQLRAHYGDWEAGPGRCGADWYVNGVEGGTPELGSIDDCGLYRAPAADFPPGLALVAIDVSEPAVHSLCAECCPYAFTYLQPR